MYNNDATHQLYIYGGLKVLFASIYHPILVKYLAVATRHVLKEAAGRQEPAARVTGCAAFLFNSTDSIN